jgi:hypothetical protein
MEQNDTKIVKAKGSTNWQTLYAYIHELRIRQPCPKSENALIRKILTRLYFMVYFMAASTLRLLSSVYCVVNVTYSLH